MFAAASLARPLRSALDSFAATGGAPARLVIAGSLDLARRVTELDEQPDLVALADEEIFKRLLLGRHAASYTRFATNRLVIAYADRSRHADALDSLSWPDVLSRDDVEVGRADPGRAPVGYRTLLAWKLAERHLARPGLAARLELHAARRNMRGSEAEMLALVESGSADYVWAYESSARAAGLRVLRLPAWMDFSDPAQQAWYASESLRVAGRSPADSIVLGGEAIVYILSVPRTAPHAQSATRLAGYLVGQAGARALREAGLDVLSKPDTVTAEAKP